MTLQDISYTNGGLKRVDILGVVLCKILDEILHSNYIDTRNDSHEEAKRVDI
jgi:hypothetical protein